MNENLRCDLNCEECRKALSLLNNLFKVSFGIPFTTHHCILELINEVRTRTYEDAASSLENEIFLNRFRKAWREVLDSEEKES